MCLDVVCRLGVVSVRLRLWGVAIFLRNAESFGVRNLSCGSFSSIYRARWVSSWALGLGVGAYVERCRRRDEAPRVGASFNERIKPPAALGSRSEKQIDASRRWRPLPVKSVPSGAAPICGGDFQFRPLGRSRAEFATRLLNSRASTQK